MRIALAALSLTGSRHGPASLVRAEALPLVRNGLQLPAFDRAAILLFSVLSAIYFAQAATIAAHAPFWMDEILTIWTARLPDTAAVWSALLHGAEFTPPLYDWLIHALYQVGITSALGLRLPSILAIYITALATGAIAHRHAGLAPAALAAGAVLSSGLFGYAIQARPYALVTAAFACALALYDRRGHPTNRRLAAIALLLTLAIGLHFYALLLAAGLAILELFHARVGARTPCWRTLAAIALAASSILLWLPILLAARAYSGNDVFAPNYYAKPQVIALVRTYAMLLGWLILPLIGMLAASIAKQRETSPLRVTALLVSAVPIGVLVFALFVSHSYADRYALAGGIGVALLFASLAQQLGARAAPASVLFLVLFILGSTWRSGGELGKTDRLDALATVRAAPRQLPIVTGSGLRFLEIHENISSGAQLIFLDTPTTPSDDPTNRNQVLRWKALDGKLRVEDADAFLCATPAFYLFAQPPDGGADMLSGWLSSRADFTPPPPGRASVTLVHARPCAISRPTTLQF